MKRYRKEDREAREVSRQLDDWNRGLPSSTFMQDQEPQRGVRGLSALHLADLCPENRVSRKIVRQMRHWEGSCWVNGLAWVESFHRPRDWLNADSWCHLASKTLG